MSLDDKGAGKLRLRQLQAVERFVLPTMIANVVCSSGLTILLFRDHPVVLGLWMGLNAGLSFWRIGLCLSRSRYTSRDRASPRAIRQAEIQGAFLAVCLASAPAWLLTQTSGMVFTILVCLLTGFLWAGGLVLATVPLAAAAYVTIVVTLTIAGSVIAAPDINGAFITFLFIVGGATVLRSGLRQFGLLCTNQQQQSDLEKQSELITLLLKDYEEQASDWLWETDASLRFQHVSDRFVEVAGLSRAEIEGVSLGTLFAETLGADEKAALQLLLSQTEARQPFRDQVVFFARGEKLFWWSFSGRPFFDSDAVFCGYRGVCADVTAAKQAETRILHLAHYDSLTDLPNRSLFSQNLETLLAAPQKPPLVLLGLDLDGFKAVNDRFGHPVGDVLLVEAAGRLTQAIEGGGLVARLGGDEFIILQTTFRSVGEVEALADRIIEALRAPFLIQGMEVCIGVSIGIAFGHEDGKTAEALMRNVDAALYRAKFDGRGTYRFFSSEMDGLLQKRRALIQDMRSALLRKEFLLYYQPYVSALTGETTGCEALLRWRHPDRGLVSPAEFVPLAEESGMIVEIGEWVLREACREAASWPGDQRISVNVSPLQFRDRSLPRTILSCLVDNKLSPARLEIEVTEAVLIVDSDATLDILRQIKALGVRIALDDFGTGYSSLSYLRDFPFDKVKIDRSFVSDLASRRDSQVIVRAIGDIAQGLSMSITAEGVETQEQADHLRAARCDELQGFLFSRPKPSAELVFPVGGELEAHLERCG